MSRIQIIDDVWFSPPPSFFAQRESTGRITNMQIEPCGYFEGGINHQEDNNDFLQYAHNNLQVPPNDSGYAPNIASSPLVEYLEEEYLNEFEMLIRSAEQTDTDDNQNMEPENNDANERSFVISLKVEVDMAGNHMQVDRTVRVSKNPVVRIERLTDGFIKEMTERAQPQQDSTQHTQNTKMNNKKRKSPKKPRISKATKNAKSIRMDAIELNDANDNVEFKGFNEPEIDMAMIFGDVHDFDGPEVTVGEVAAEQMIDVSSKTIILDKFTCKMKRFQPKVVLVHTPMHKMLEYIAANSSSDSSSSVTKPMKVCIQSLICI